MSYGLQISASGVMTALYRQDVFANNLANSDTIGFKSDIPSTLARQSVRKEDGVPFLPSNALLERLGGGVLMNPNRVEFTQGNLRDTGNDLDLGVLGEGFFVVRDAADSSGDSLRLTRDGRMTRNKEGTLVMASTGMPVLDVQNRPIQLSAFGDITVGGDGTIRQDNQAIARLAFIDIPDRMQIRKQGHSLFLPNSDALAAALPAKGTIKQHVVEDASVDPVRALMAMTSAAREVDSNVSMMQQHDKMTERAISSLGRPTT